jgi:hypothetical protein
MRVFQITRGVAPAKSIATVCFAVTKHQLPYTLLDGMTAADAKQEAARRCWEAGEDLLLVEDDVMPFPQHWERVLAQRNKVQLCSARMSNGELNCWFVSDGNRDRLVYSGTVFLYVPWAALDTIGAPWFSPHNLEFCMDGGGQWVDHGPNARGEHSDVWFFYRCWQCGIEPRVIGNVVHIVQGNGERDLSRPSGLKALGVYNVTKLEV